MPSRRDQHPRYKIKTLSRNLRKLSFPSSPIPLELARFAADAFDKFLSAECASLDEAFGVKKGPGAPPKLSTAKHHLKLAREVDRLRRNKKSWYQIAELLGIDDRTLRRIYARFKIRLQSEHIASQL